LPEITNDSPAQTRRLPALHQKHFLTVTEAPRAGKDSNESRPQGTPGRGFGKLAHFTLLLPGGIVRAMRRNLSYFLLVGVLLAGCSGPGQSSHHGQNPPSAPEPYVRIANSDSNVIQLQIAARQFLPRHRSEPAVWLTGVSHIGESNYYATLQTHLDAQTLVLFEGVGAAERENMNNDSETAVAKDESKTESPTENSENHASLQSAIAASLGLVFQLEAIDYRRPSFRNSDLSISQLRQLMSKAETGSGETSASESFENLIQLMDGSSWFDSLVQLALRFLGASPKLQALGRLALIDLLGQIQGDPSRLGRLPPDMKQLLEVLLQRRNEKVIADLKEEVKRIGPNGSIAIFFGTGHMPDLEARLRSELNYRPTQDVWFTAFDVNLTRAKITTSERDLVDNFVKWQLAAAGAAGRSPN
jgi:hypothetical protein